MHVKELSNPRVNDTCIKCNRALRFFEIYDFAVTVVDRTCSTCKTKHRIIVKPMSYNKEFCRIDLIEKSDITDYSDPRIDEIQRNIFKKRGK